jgi:predicted PurR-regulated permease PerM
VPIRFVNTSGLADVAHGLMIAALIIVFLYVAGPIVEPLAIAALLSFILAPVMRRLRAWGAPKVLAAILCVGLTLSVIAVLTATLGLQARQLAQDLPTYETNLREKVKLLGNMPFLSGVLDRASGTLRDLQDELSRPESRPVASQAGGAPKPLPVEVHQPEPRGLEAISNIVRPLLSPLATTALVILFLLFILLQREDIRDRFLRLAGTADLQRSTATLNDAATRLGQFYMMQLLLNTAFGIVIAVALVIIGVPNAVLWGILAGLMRFVPFIGSLIAAFFPIAVAAAADPGWTMPLMTAALFIVAEPAAGQVIEPLVFGQRTGLSPVAVVLSTLFWTLLWGPVGLLLATPLTVCLVVLGKHTEGLKFIDVLLGDDPPLLPEERFYQRLLAGDATDATDQAEEELKTHTLSAYYDAIPMKALVLAQADAAEGKLSDDRQQTIRSTMDEIIDDLDEYRDESPDDEPIAKISGDDEGASIVEQVKPAASTSRVLCVASRSPLDQTAASMLAQVLTKRGLSAVSLPYERAGFEAQLPIDARAAKMVCLSYFGVASKPAHVRYLIRRLRRLMPRAKFVACFWMLRDDRTRLEEWKTTVNADFAIASLEEAATICCAEMLSAGTAELVSADPNAVTANSVRSAA